MAIFSNNTGFVAPKTVTFGADNIDALKIPYRIVASETTRALPMSTEKVTTVQWTAVDV